MIIYKSLLKENSKVWPRGQAVKTSPFHGGNTGSIPVGVICRFLQYVSIMPMWLNWQSS